MTYTPPARLWIRAEELEDQKPPILSAALYTEQPSADAYQYAFVTQSDRSTTEEFIAKLARLPLIVRSSPNEVFQAVRELQETAQRSVSTSLTPVVEQEKARYESAHEARYTMTHEVHPDIVVLWFLALKSHWFNDPNNMFYGMREQAKAYLYKWVETGELADDNTTLEIATASKFRDWLKTSWTTATPSPSVAARAAAEAVGEYLQAPPSMWDTIERLITQRMGHGEIERDAMIETIKELERDRDALKQVARMALQQFEFTYGKCQRGWDAAFLMERLRAVIADSEGTGEFAGTPSSAVIHQARAAAEHLERENFLLSDVTPEEHEKIVAVITHHFCSPVPAAHLQDAIDAAQGVQNDNDLDDGGFFEAGFIAARTRIIDALIALKGTYEQAK